MIIPKYCLYTDGQVFVKRKESYIAVTDDKGGVIFFAMIGFKTIRESEGLAILKALEYFQKHNIIEGTIYTDSSDWAGIANGNHRVPTSEKHNDTFLLASEVISLKEELLTTIQWKSRIFNRAGMFLGDVWRMKKAKRDKYINRFILPDQPKVSLEQ